MPMPEENGIPLNSLQLPSTARVIADFCHKLLGPAAEQIGESLGERLVVFRLNNLLKIRESVEKILQDKGSPQPAGSHLPPSVGLPLIDKASYEDDPKLQSMWANLIANSLISEGNQDSDLSLDKIHVEILHQFSKLDCDVLEYLVENGIACRDPETGIMPARMLDPESVINDVADPLTHLSIEKLVSLGCASLTPRVPIEFGTGRYGNLVQDLRLTLIGLHLFLLASGKKPSWS